MGTHDGHRERLRERFLEHGLDNFNELNALELLLFYSMPRIDTNPIAHALLDRFGCLAGIFEAPVQELMQVKGVGERTATLLRLVPQMVKKAEVTRATRVHKLNGTSEYVEYLKPRFMFERTEVFIMLLMDPQGYVIACLEMSRGVTNEVDVNIRKVIETALQYGASRVVLAHNHPDGPVLNSREDDAVTSRLKQVLNYVNITLDDHIIFTAAGHMSYRRSGVLGIM